jgi:uncharacterized membrane protein YphA (DoxX/SURF4 family)
MNDMLDSRIAATWWALRIALGATAFLAGLDKFFNLLADWPVYLSPLVQRTIPATPQAFMYFVGIIEMLVGLLILFGSARLGGYIVSAWLVGISLNLVTTGAYFDIAVRDLVMAVAAFGLARLSEYRQELTMEQRKPLRSSGQGFESRA